MKTLKQHSRIYGRTWTVWYFREVNEVEEKNREDAYEYECGSKCVDFVLGTEGVMNIVDGIELIECNEKVDSDHRGYLIDVNLEEFFESSFSIWWFERKKMRFFW